LDTNLFAEILLRQTQADQVKKFLQQIPPDDLYLTEFSLYSIGIILIRQRMYEAFLHFIDDTLISGGIRIIRLGIEDMPKIVETAQKSNLDFDDAYQYIAAEKYDLTIVSLDSDFDRTQRGRKTPAEALK
jgi:predicted nucleic acid-binding protein